MRNKYIDLIEQTFDFPTEEFKVIDNELYLMNQLGQAFDQNNRHGETKAQVSAFGTNAYSITTFLGSYLIQYTKQ